MSKLTLSTLVMLCIACSSRIQDQSTRYLPTYLEANYDRADHVDGITPNRLKNLKGDIAKLTQYDYDAVKDSIGNFIKGRLTQGTPVYTLVFGDSRRIVEEWHYKIEDKPSSKFYLRDYATSTYDSAIFWDDAGDVRTVWKYEYDEYGIMIQHYENWSGDEKWKVDSVANQGDTLIRYGSYTTDYFVGNRIVKSVHNQGNRYYLYEYYTSGRIKRETTHAQGRLTLDERFDEHGNLLFYKSTNYKGDSVDYENERNITYDSSLRKTSEKGYSYSFGYKLPSHQTYEYDEAGRLTRIYEHKDDDEQVFAYYQYNGQGDVIESKIIGPVERFEYRYDEKGNWIERTHYVRNEPFKITVRIFEYL